MRHSDYCYDHKLIDNVNWTEFRLYKWTDLNIKAYRQKFIIGDLEN